MYRVCTFTSTHPICAAVVRIHEDEVGVDSAEGKWCEGVGGGGGGRGGCWLVFRTRLATHTCSFQCRLRAWGHASIRAPGGGGGRTGLFARGRPRPHLTPGAPRILLRKPWTRCVFCKNPLKFSFKSLFPRFFRILCSFRKRYYCFFISLCDWGSFVTCVCVCVSVVHADLRTHTCF